MASLTPVANRVISKTEVGGLELEGQQITASSDTGSTDGVKKNQRTFTAASRPGNWTHGRCAPAVQYP